LTDLAKRFRQWLSDAFRGWGFTVFERRAILLLCLLVILASSFRYYRNRSLGVRLSEFPTADSLTDPYSEPDPQLHILLDINRATASELERLPGVGPVKAGKIVELRVKLGGFKEIKQLDQVEGIGKKTIERLKPFVVVGLKTVGNDSMGN